MGNPTYSATAFLEVQTDFAIDTARDRLTAHPGLDGARIEQIDDKELHMHFGDFCLKIAIWDEPGTLEENQEMFPPGSTDPKIPIVSQCPRRIHVWSKDADPEMDHFNDYLISVEVLSNSFCGFHAQDDASGEWFD